MNYWNIKSGLVLAICITVIALTTVVTGQNTAPPPSTKPDETPVVISRDEMENDEPPVTDVRESTDPGTTASPILSRDMTAIPAPTPAYNISLSDAQQKMILYLDFLSKTESRAENLRTKLFEMIEKENSVKLQIQRVEYGLSPERLQNSAALIGSLRPEDVRDERRRMLQSERNNLQALLRQVELSRAKLESGLSSADRLVERVRARFEAYVDRALSDEFEELQ